MSLKDKTIAVIGAGNMGEALIRGLLATRTVVSGQLLAADVRPERREYIERTFGVRSTGDNAAAVARADIVLLAVKPQQMGEVLASLREGMSPQKLVVTIAAGVKTERIERELGYGTRVVRVMPNTPAQVLAGVAALSRGRHATMDDLAVAEAILGAVGITARTKEDLLDAVTALSGSGPAYVFLVTEAMIRAGVEMGMTSDLAKKLAVQTVFGAARLMLENGEEPESLRRKVTSPGGTTEAALKVMREGMLMEVFVDAIKAAEKRSKELASAG